MKSGLEGRNNDGPHPRQVSALGVSMKSGLEGRNNLLQVAEGLRAERALGVSMKSGLEGRNNPPAAGWRLSTG